MKRFLAGVAAAFMAVALFAGGAAAEELRGRVAVSAKLGVVNPSDNERSQGIDRIVVPTDAGFLIGGGILYGLDDSVAFELDIARTSVHTPSWVWGDVEVKDLSVGVQYRFPERSRLVPYGSAGLDVLINDAENRQVSAIDTVFGAHLAAGVDYVLTRQVVLNGEIRGVESFSADVKNLTGSKMGSFDPTSLAFTIGARFFFN